MLEKLKNSKLLAGDSTYAQLLRTYIVGGFNLVFGLGISYLFQFFVFYSIEIPLRTYLTKNSLITRSKISTFGKDNHMK